jgi:L-lactate utilization protein LutB
MEQFERKFWEMRLEACKEALEKNKFEVFIAENPVDAQRIFLEHILPEIEVENASWGDSMTLKESGILDALKRDPAIDVIETFAPDLTREQSMERRRQALLVDLFCTGSNALTQTGKLVNLDMVGNRVGGLTFGPKHVVLLIGRNKIVRDVEEAFDRVKSHAAPLNAIRHDGWKTPCIKTSFCMDCNSPDRICNTWVITEKSYPPKRIKIILVNQDLGL